MKAAAVKSNKQKESRAAAHSIFQKKNDPKGPLGLGDNRPGPGADRSTSVTNDPAGSSKFIRLYAPSQVPQTVVQPQPQSLVVSTLQRQVTNNYKDDGFVRKAGGEGEQTYQRRIKKESKSSQIPNVKVVSPVVQGRWLVFDDKKEYFWEQDGTAKTKPHVGLANEGYKEIDQPDKDTYRVNSRSRRHQMARTLELWLANPDRKSQRSAVDIYNPFGRFDANAKMVAFIPASQLDHSVVDLITQQLREKCKNFLDIKKLSVESDRSGYPKKVLTTNNNMLTLASATQLGAIYSDRAGGGGRAAITRAPLQSPVTIGVSEDVKIAENWLDKKSVEYWAGQDRKIQQGQIMGTSAGEAAASAGFDPSEGLGWEWLHLIAHSMGGIETVGPQVAANLVVGTSECNTEMIIVEEFIKDLVTKQDRKAKLFVAAKMFDKERHIAGKIIYDFLIMDEKSRPIDVFHWSFDPLSRTQPIVEANRGIRYAARVVMYGRTGKQLPQKKETKDMEMEIEEDISRMDEEEEESAWEKNLRNEWHLNIGYADGTGNLCLLNTLSSLLSLANINVTAEGLAVFFAGAGVINLGEMIDVYNRDVTQAIAAQYGVMIQVHQVDDQTIIHHPPIGTGGMLLHILHQENHFSPLLPVQ
jgi:hypothetical protein